MVSGKMASQRFPNARTYGCHCIGKGGAADVILRWEFILDDLDGPEVITRILIRRKQEIREGIRGM